MAVLEGVLCAQSDAKMDGEIKVEILIPRRKIANTSTNVNY